MVQVIKSLQDPLKVGNKLRVIDDNVGESGLEQQCFWLRWSRDHTVWQTVPIENTILLNLLIYFKTKTKQQQHNLSECLLNGLLCTIKHSLLDINILHELLWYDTAKQSLSFKNVTCYVCIKTITSDIMTSDLIQIPSQMQKCQNTWMRNKHLTNHLHKNKLKH